MALYKDTYKCRKCGQTFTWYYQPAQEDGYGYRPKSSSEEKIAMVSGMMLVAEQIYEVTVDCPCCGATNDFNCKIEQELPGLKKHRLITERHTDFKKAQATVDRNRLGRIGVQQKLQRGRCGAGGGIDQKSTGEADCIGLRLLRGIAFGTSGKFMVQRKVDLRDDLDKLPVCLCLQQKRNKVDSVRCKREGVFRKGKVLSCHRLWKQVQYRGIDGLGIPESKIVRRCRLWQALSRLPADEKRIPVESAQMEWLPRSVGQFPAWLEQFPRSVG